MRLEVCNSQPASHHTLASLSGTLKAEKRGVAAHSHRVPSLRNQASGTAGALGVVCCLARAQECYISLQVC